MEGYIRSCETVTVYFAGAFRGYSQGTGAGRNLVPQYRHRGVFQFTEEQGRIICEGMEFSRHISKISLIRNAEGQLTYGQWCPVCRKPIPQSHDVCPKCNSHLERPEP